MISDREIERAVAVLKAGGLVAFPTETVYGLGADASSPAALAKLYAAKGRPAEHPVIVHLADAVQLDAWARDIPQAARVLARTFWPGPLTLVLRRQPHVLDAVTGGQDTIGLRVPSHPVARRLLAAFGSGIAAPSANRFGRVSSTSAEHVQAEFGDEVGIVLDGGPCEVGIESTIVDLSGAAPALLRPGGVPAGDIARALGTVLGSAQPGAPRAPGSLARHYAPRTPLMLVEGDLLVELAASLTRQQQKVAVLALSALRPLLEHVVWRAASAEPAAYARELYASLRELDAAGCDVLLVEQVPDAPEWLAVRDRLARAATRAP
ncbi:MAG TPA: L-threonylcarbamoyladenylate synthase [Burkholderiales bacterium]|nr:L-threonylcarbamoyladenylate synthase [Burkholderiales bacterium]